MSPFVEALSIVTASFGVIVACYALHLAFCTRIECRAMKESTHNVQYVPYSPPGLDDDTADLANSAAEVRDYEKLADDFQEREEPLM